MRLLGLREKSQWPTIDFMRNRDRRAASKVRRFSIYRILEDEMAMRVTILTRNSVFRAERAYDRGNLSRSPSRRVT